MADTHGQVRESAPIRTNVELRSSDHIQGNILAGFNKSHQAFMFLRFDPPGADRARVNARAWLAELTHPGGDHLATTRQVVDFNDRFHRERQRLNGRIPADLKAIWVNASLTYSGLITLHPELAPDLDPYQAFRSGPAGVRVDKVAGRTTTAALLGDEGDSHPVRWVIGGPGEEPDALVTIAADRRDDLLGRLKEERRRAERSGLVVLREEIGENLPGDRHGTEHFGFKDGISQPGIRGFTNAVVRSRRMEDADYPGSQIIASGEFLLGRVRERRTPEVNHPPVPPWMCDGSFQVFRRLTQDVPAWQAAMQQLRPPSLTSAELAAKAVGRWPDGKPLARRRGPGYNDFDYDSDPAGYDTPRWAHIRRMQPRSNAIFGDRAHRILRRGITFGPLYDPDASPQREPAERRPPINALQTLRRGIAFRPFFRPNASPRGEQVERGLLFNAFMASIEEQFEFLQRAWANDPRFPSVPLDTSTREEAFADGIDPVLGAGTHPCVFRQQGSEDRRLEFGRFIHTTGAVYAFTPSIPTLQKLASSDQLWPG